jgi:hypothetical protein
MPPPPGGTNGFAVASLVFGIIGGVLFAVIFGIVALTQIRRRNQTGKGMAVAGLVLSGVWLLACGGLVAVVAISEPDRNSEGNLTEEGSVSSRALKLGDCLKKVPSEGVVLNVDVLPCTQPHGAEVYAVLTLSGSTYPGEAAIIKEAEEGCTAKVDVLTEDARNDDSAEIFYIYPESATAWRRGDHEVSCIVGSETKQFTGSMRK